MGERKFEEMVDCIEEAEEIFHEEILKIKDLNERLRQIRRFRALVGNIICCCNEEEYKLEGEIERRMVKD